ncbi:hypothetical protein BGZ63DRAFT_406001 [Mariannaea sp. PMI_226]|nr:hypothetical protein BGZ63DRAFT_406001 [Mariannaea sp. PMI_226]
MVYCGKASQGCQNCRTRRIKCDKVKPECSQCMRVGKKCPGYRDQLSLMFRDESSKVIQKAHAQWGVGDASDDAAQPQACASSTACSSEFSMSSTSSWATSPLAIASHQTLPLTPPSSALSPSSLSRPPTTNGLPPTPTALDPSLEERGLQFYLNRYLIGHPDEPKTSADLASIEWLWDPSLQDIMTAIGLASLSNLRGDRNLMLAARQKYVQALQQTGKLIQTSVAPDFEVSMRGVIMLAMFEACVRHPQSPPPYDSQCTDSSLQVVKGTHQGIGHVRAHVMGGIAILRRWCPMPEAAFRGIRGMVQMCLSLFISLQVSQTAIPTPLLEWLQFSGSLLEPADRPACELGFLMTECVQLSVYVETHVLSDGRPSTTTTLQKLLQLDADFVRWEQGLVDTWLYKRIQAPHLPSAAIFDGEYHIYYDMWAARMWAHYRWARILINQTIVEIAKRSPLSSKSFITVAECDDRLEIIRNLARDMLVSTPSHWRHPLLEEKISVQHEGGAGSGSAGIPVVIFQLKVAACAPGVPASYWDWVYGILECIWGDLGMLQAKSMMDVMMAHKDSLCRKQTDGIVVSAV